MYTQVQLLEVTEKLLLEYGYEGFHLKRLSEHLDGARSTIYLYYSNKEEIVSACMKNVMTGILQQIEALDEEQLPLVALKEILGIFLTKSQIHLLLKDAPKINAEQNEHVKNNMNFVMDSHQKIKEKLMHLFLEAQKNGEIRADVPLPILIGVFFSLIDVPRMEYFTKDEYNNYLFSTWFEGAKR